tara:strand:- start:146 stop:532 length:387 start_codon:yes stop_codon:yes gene_type:complete
MVIKVNIRKLNLKQREACRLLRLFCRRAGFDVSRCIVSPIMSGENKGGMLLIQPEKGDFLFRLEELLKREKTLIYLKSIKDGVIYMNRWSTGWEALQFTNHLQARIWASKNDCRYEHNIPMLPSKVSQ